jgi:transcriptional regulator with XRE-family HTH domain
MDDYTMQKVRELFEQSGKTLDALGRAMGYSDDVARKAVWQFMKTNDPRLSMLRKFAKAMDIPLEELIAEKKSRSR